jgi:hypothetical protein
MSLFSFKRREAMSKCHCSVEQHGEHVCRSSTPFALSFGIDSQLRFASGISQVAVFATLSPEARAVDHHAHQTQV